jgi:small-conductance mechanosensitive channel
VDPGWLIQPQGGDVFGVVGAAALAAVGALLVLEVVHRVLLRLGRRSPLFAELAQRAHRPTQAVVVLVALQLTLRQLTTAGDWRPALLHALWLGIIAAGAWLVAALLLVLEDVALARFRTDVEDNRHARRVHTQITVIRRVTVAVVALVAIGAMLVTFPAARAAGASLLASAGVAGVIAGLAAQSLLGNVFAGIQLAFSDALRLDDVVVVENEWGRIEEITLSYVVVHIWDDRRLVLPTSYFTSKPFQNWTRYQAAVLGTVELDVDWSVPMEPLRAELDRVLAGSDLWDERVGVLQVTEAVNGFVRVRALVSAVDAPTLWDLRCLVRERLVGWLQEEHPAALPRIRAEVGRDGREPPRPAPVAGADGDARVFGGSPDGRQRRGEFTGPDEDLP